ncbi:MAG: hypothetical protein GXP42_18720 [Chloroflexi bacterium]|nr:hypothetical protein [Chloroflexota bacterium]
MNLQRFLDNNVLLALLTIVVLAMGYLFLRSAYYAAAVNPYVQEFVLVVLGSLITVMITAMLLNKQTEVELKKEGDIKFLDLKRDIYMELIDHLEDVVLSGRTSDEDVVKLRFLSQKLAVVASPEVLVQFEKFIQTFLRVSEDEDLENREAEDLMDALSVLTITIRADLVGGAYRDHPFGPTQIARQIVRNNDLFD